MKGHNKNISFVLCIENKDCDDLEKRKVYQVLPTEKGIVNEKAMKGLQKENAMP
jgi:hypothetical protein